MAFFVFLFALVITLKVFNDLQRQEKIQILLKAGEDARLLSIKILRDNPYLDKDSLFKEIFGGQIFRYSLYDPKGNLLAYSKIQIESFSGKTSESVFFQGLIAASEWDGKKYGFVENDTSSSLSLPLVLNGDLLGVLIVEGSPEIYSIEKIKPLILILFGVLFIFSLFFIAGSNSDIFKTFDSIKRLLEKSSENEREIIFSEKETAFLGDDPSKFTVLTGARTKEGRGNIIILEKIIEVLPFSAMLIESSGKIVLCNSVTKNLFSKETMDRITGHYYREIFGEEELFNIISKVDKTGISIKAEIQLRGLYCDIVVDKITFDTRSYFLVFANDISEKIKTEERQNRFIINTAHELKTPLSIINGFLEIYEGESDENKKKFLYIIKNNLVRLNNLVGDLLLLTKTDDPNFLFDFKKTDLKIIAEETLLAFEQKAKLKQIEFKTSFPEDEIFVFGDNFLLSQMLINLVDNAVKYTKTKGKIEVLIKKRKGLVVLAVRDNGIGIPEKYKKEVFSRFFTVDKSRSRELGGTGLGLSIVKNIVERHSGYIEFESEMDKGTTFFVSFPEFKN